MQISKNQNFKNTKCADDKYKTELCKKYSETGKCPYGTKCLFAHGKDELITKKLCTNYKKKQCKTFFENGYCPYGSRCTFKHSEYNFENTKLIFNLISKIFLNDDNNNVPRAGFYNGNGSHFIHLFGETTPLNNYDLDKCISINEYQRNNSSSFSTVSNED